MAMATDDRHLEFTSACIERLRNFQRPPKGVAEALQAAQIASEDSPEKVFLEKGSTIWFAYFLVKRAADNQVTFDGKATCRKVIDELNEASIEIWKSQAEQLKDGISLVLHDKVQDALSGQRKRARRSHAYLFSLL